MAKRFLDNKLLKTTQFSATTDRSLEQPSPQISKEKAEANHSAQIRKKEGKSRQRVVDERRKELSRLVKDMHGKMTLLHVTNSRKMKQLQLLLEEEGGLERELAPLKDEVNALLVRNVSDADENSLVGIAHDIESLRRKLLRLEIESRDTVPAGNSTNTTADGLTMDQVKSLTFWQLSRFAVGLYWPIALALVVAGAIVATTIAITFSI